MTRSGSWSGGLQPANGAPLSEHSNSTSSSFEENMIVTSLFVVVPDGPESIVVCGSVRSTISHVRVAGSPNCRYELVACTVKVCERNGFRSVPVSCASLYVTGEVHTVNGAP